MILFDFIGKFKVFLFDLIGKFDSFLFDLIGKMLLPVGGKGIMAIGSFVFTPKKTTPHPHSSEQEQGCWYIGNK